LLKTCYSSKATDCGVTADRSVVQVHQYEKTERESEAMDKI